MARNLIAALLLFAALTGCSSQPEPVNEPKATYTSVDVDGYSGPTPKEFEDTSGAGGKPKAERVLYGMLLVAAIAILGSYRVDPEAYRVAETCP